MEDRDPPFSIADNICTSVKYIHHKREVEPVLLTRKSISECIWSKELNRSVQNISTGEIMKALKAVLAKEVVW